MYHMRLRITSLNRAEHGLYLGILNGFTSLLASYKGFSGVATLPKMATAVTPTRTTCSPATILSSTPLMRMSDSLSTSPVLEASVVEVDNSREDLAEIDTVEEFMSSTCGCKIGPKSTPCCTFLTRDTIEKYRSDNLDLTRDELDLVILGQIRACCSVPYQPSLRSMHHEKKSSRSVTQYYACGIQVCRQTFMFLHCVSHKILENLIKHYDKAGLCTRTHGNTKRLPKNTISLEDTTRIITFISNYARAHAMPVPGRLPNHKDKVMILPSDVTKFYVYPKYKDACTTNNWTPVGRSKFYDIWQHQLPHISISTPSTDLCFTCHQNSLSLQKSGYLSEEEKARLLASAQEHISRAKVERVYYNSQVEAVQKAWNTAQSNGVFPRIAHYSYDFAQQIHFPYETARKCGLFGVCNDGNNKHVLYLIDEAENPGKGADCVISLVHHYIESYGHGEKCLYLHADNCVGQNKNNATIQYLLWRVMTGKQDSIELSFMLVGHTKFSPDRHFGTFKKAFRVSPLSTLAEISAVVDKTSTNIPQLIRNVSGTVLVPFYQWTAYLGQFFRTIPNITSYHRFRVSSD